VQEPVWIDAGDLKRLRKGDVLRVLRKGQEYYSAFRFDGLLQECDYTYDGDAPFVWLEVGMATLDKIVYTRKDLTTGAIYADRGDRVELFQPINKELLTEQPASVQPVAYAEYNYKKGRFTGLTTNDINAVDSVGDGCQWVPQLQAFAAPAQEIVCSTGLCHYRKPLTAKKTVKLKDAFYAGFDAYDTPAAPYSDVNEEWSKYKAAHGIKENT
jgi:hypothetical protein